MFPLKCNIDKTDRINRVVIGIILLLAALLGLGPVFFALVSIVLIVQGAIGWCSIPYLMDKLNKK